MTLGPRLGGDIAPEGVEQYDLTAEEIAIVEGAQT
jgi:hypothetical protein